MYPLYLAGAAVLGAGAYLFTRKKPIPPAVAQAAVQAPPPAQAPRSAPLGPSSPEAQAAAAAAQGVIVPSSPEVQAAVALQQAATDFSQGLAFPGTGINPGIQSATQFNPAPGPQDFLSAASQAATAVSQTQTAPEAGAFESAAQAASDAVTSSGLLSSPADQASNIFDALNVFTDPNQE